MKSVLLGCPICLFVVFSFLLTQVWGSCLSESDRKLLSQFLPSGISTSQAVRSLLKGENLQFGNQFTKWQAILNIIYSFVHVLAFSQNLLQIVKHINNYIFNNVLIDTRSASVCRGDMHPDAVRRNEKQFLSDKKAYYVELNNYHSRFLQKLSKILVSFAFVFLSWIQF